MTTPTSTFELITPEIATRYLTNKAKNRNPRPLTVRSYAFDMMDGKWTVSSDAICFNQEGRLIDGQHRLLACIQADVPFRSFVIRGMTEDDLANVNTGVSRTIADYFNYDGFKEPALLAASIRQLDTLMRKVPADVYSSRNPMPPRSRLVAKEFVNYNPDLMEAVSVISSFKRPKGLCPGSVLAAIWTIGSRITSKDIATEFVESFSVGTNLTADSPILAMRNRCLEDRDSRVSATMHRKPLNTFRRMQGVARAWNWWMIGKPVGRTGFTIGNQDATLPWMFDMRNIKLPDAMRKRADIHIPDNKPWTMPQPNQ